MSARVCTRSMPGSHCRYGDVAFSDFLLWKNGILFLLLQILLASF